MYDKKMPKTINKNNHIFILLLSTLSALLRNSDRFDDDDEDGFDVDTMVTLASPVGSDSNMGEGER